MIDQTLNIYKRYDCTLENAKTQLETLGVAVIQIFTPAECEQLRQRAWSDINRIIQTTPDNPDSYANLEKLCAPGAIIVRNAPLGHLQWVWDIRQDPRVAEVFSQIWGVAKEDLLTSFDSLSLQAPPEVTNQGWFDGTLKIHTDQSRLRTSFCCVQGLVNLYPVNPGDATLFVLEESHKFHQDYFESQGIESTSEYYALKEGGVEYFLRKGCTPGRVLANEGSLVLWDSRVFHAPSKPMKERVNPNFRIVSYICMMPRSMSNQEAIYKRFQKIKEKVISNHWANDPNYFEHLENVGFPFSLSDIDSPKFTQLGRRLVGFDE